MNVGTILIPGRSLTGVLVLEGFAVKQWAEELSAKFGDRVRFDPIEMMMYSHDVGSLPEMVEKLVNNTPQAVVQPESLDELVFLARLARRHKIPIVPRGAGTSGYGGVVPVKSGMVVAFTRFEGLSGVDRDAMTATVKPGTVWTDLEKELGKYGLMLRLYPTSAPGSTVGGWVGEGGSGIGSYEYGTIAENIVEAVVVTPTGEIRTVQGRDLDLVNRAEGTTGFIAAVTVKVRPADEDVVVVGSFPDIRQLVAVIQEAKEKAWPLWHVSVSTADFVRTKSEAFVKAAAEAAGEGSGHGHGAGDDPEHWTAVPHGAHLGMFVFPGARRTVVEKPLRDAILRHGGSILDEKATRHEWEERFYPMRLKRLGPSLIPSEAVVPISGLPAITDDAAKRLAGISIEGAMVGREHAALLCFMLGDERTRAYTVGFAKSLVMMDIAKRHGGRAYSTGLYFIDDAPEALGKDVLQRLAAHKKEVDPEYLFNPGKLLAESGNPPLIRAAMRAAKMGGSLIDIVEKFAGHTPRMKRPLVQSVANAAFACAQCGYCTGVCTEYAGVGWESASPRGKWHFLKQYLKGKAKLTQDMVDSFLMCTTCKRCNPVCQVQLPIVEMWDQIRPVLVQELNYNTFPAFEMMGASVESDLNIWAARRSERDAWVPEDVEIKPTADIGYWAGCTASYVQADTAENAVHILKESGVDFTYLGKDEACCGTPMLVAGKPDDFELVFRNNVEQIKKHGIKTLVISCPGCWVAFSHHYPTWARKLGIELGFEVKHLSELTDEMIREGRLKFKNEVNRTVTWHDSCHIGRHGGIYDAPRDTLRAIPGLKLEEMASNRENALCCGSVLTRISKPDVSDRLAAMKLDEATATGAEAVVSTCPCCTFQLRVGGASTGRDIPVEDFAGLVAEGLGYEAKDSTENSLYMWGVFEKAIKIMTSQGIIDMMAEMVPEIVAAMPSSMQTAMKGMTAMPNAVKKPALGAMEKMIPLMMPSMFPGMMPKLMPKVLELMKKEIPDMPPSMEEKLPEMLPKVMAKIMPGMMAEVALGVAPKMSDYLATVNL